MYGTIINADRWTRQVNRRVASNSRIVEKLARKSIRKENREIRRERRWAKVNAKSSTV